jgi:predicted DNA-binding protein
MADELIRVHVETANRLRELAEEQHRTMTATLDMIIEAEYLKVHPQPLATEEEIGRR